MTEHHLLACLATDPGAAGMPSCPAVRQLTTLSQRKLRMPKIDFPCRIPTHGIGILMPLCREKRRILNGRADLVAQNMNGCLGPRGSDDPLGGLKTFQWSGNGNICSRNADKLSAHPCSSLWTNRSRYILVGWCRCDRL